MRPLIALPLLLVLLPSAGEAQRTSAKRTPRDSAAAFMLDPQTLASEAKPEDQADAAPSPSASAAAARAEPTAPATSLPAAPAPGRAAPDAVVAGSAAPATGSVTLFTLDTPIATLIADPGAKGVLDRDLPGLSSDENLDKFRGLSLRQFQPLTGGQLTISLLAKVSTDLAALAGTSGAAIPAPVAGRKTRRDETGR